MIISKEKLAEFKKEYEILKDKVIDTSLMKNKREFAKITTEFNHAQALKDCYDKVEELEQAITDSEEMLKNETDEELLELAEMEIEESKEALDELNKEFKVLLVPVDPNDKKNCILEIRAGTGGDEAALFAADLFRMYQYYIEGKNLKMKMLSANATGIGGYKEIICNIIGKNAYKFLKYESGVHRVQRIPETESNGRVHTSAISVAVLPEAEKVDMHIEPSDIKIDTFRASGPGGQSVNTTDSAIRVTYIPENLVVSCQDEKSQIKNKEKALKILRTRLFDLQQKRHQAKIDKKRKSMVGSGDRSAKIRTYNFPQSRVTDHRIKLTSYNLDGILKGDLNEFIEKLKIAEQQAMLDD